jgi:DNA/RNA-binding domain of Phe-tRNA-synthetase-like protein
VAPATRQVLVVAEGLHATAAADVRALVEALARDLASLGAIASRPAVLTAAAPRFDFSLAPSA